MTFVCLWIPSWSTGADAPGEPRAPDESAALAVALLRVAPRIAIDEPRGLVWGDARGLRARPVAAALLACLAERGHAGVRAGIAGTAVAAEVAARHASRAPARELVPAEAAAPAIVRVPARTDRRFLAPYPIDVLAPPLPSLAAMLADVGIATCGELAALEREAVEVRFGSEGLALWRLARGDDPRRIFGKAPRTLPTASVDWVEYTLRGTEPLLFVINQLATTVCAELYAWGEGARAMVLDFALADRTRVAYPVRTARATASRATWMRRIRTELEAIRLPDAVTGVTLRVEVLAGAEASQGDLFDRGFATAREVERAVAQLVDEQRAAVIALEPSAHPLPERRVRWRASESVGLAAPSASAATPPPPPPPPPRLALQLLPAPRRIAATVEQRRGYAVPVRYRDGRKDVRLAGVVGPDRLSGSEPGARYAREYFHAVTDDGVLVLLFRDARSDVWYVHGWWD
jgi:protein ImuB